MTGREYVSISGLAPAVQLRLLARAELELEGLIPWSSNYTFLASATAQVPALATGSLRFLVIYKPCRGERPLWDFGTSSEARGSLCHREVAAYLLSHSLGWPDIPPVILRDGPYGLGSVQAYVDADPNEHYFRLRDQNPQCDAFRRIALFDMLVNNADRKAGHLLKSADGRIWVIDHGLTFHVAYKLRTVIWDYAGETIPSDLLADTARALRLLRSRDTELAVSLRRMLSSAERRALARRARAILRRGVFSLPRDQWRNVPYPLI